MVEINLLKLMSSIVITESRKAILSPMQVSPAEMAVKLPLGYLVTFTVFLSK